MSDQIVAPSHYVFETQAGTFQVRHITEAFLNRAIKAIGPNDYVTPWALHCIVESITYLLRCPFKGSFRSDLRKAIHYLDLALEAVTDDEPAGVEQADESLTKLSVETILDVYRREGQAFRQGHRWGHPHEKGTRIAGV